MKKTLLTLAAILVSFCSLSATEVTFEFKTNNYGLPAYNTSNGNSTEYVEAGQAITNENVTLTFNKTSGNGFRMWSDGLRVYNTGSGNASIKISIPEAKVTAIDMTVKAVLGTVKINDAALTYTSATKTYSWTGNEADPTIVITVSATKAIETLKIVYEADDPSDTRKPADMAFAEAAYLVNEGEAFAAPELTKATTAAVTYTSSNPAVATVDATTGAVTVVGFGTTEIKANADANTEFKAGEASYELTVLKVVNSIAETMAITDENLKLRVNYPLTVAFKNFNNTFAFNGEDFIQVYGTQPDYKVGDVIPAGWIANYALFNKITPELTNPLELQAASENVGFTPAEVDALTTADVNKVVTLKNVVFAEATPSDKKNFNGTVGETEYAFRNNYTIAGVEAGTYNVTGVVNIFNNAVSFYVTKYEEVTSTGIDSIEADVNAPVEYYNLQGIRVNNPENGLYIRRQGNKVTKVIVK